jgi:hypothetical protein
MTKELTVTNLYGVRGTVTHRTDANILVVTGDNGAGKSSFVEAFAHIFCHKAVKGAPDPVHTGEDAAEATFTDDDGTAFTRKWRGGKMAALEIRAHDGAKYAQASDLLAKKLGAVTVDVSSFLAVDEKVRRDAILAKSKLPEGVDFAALNQGVAAAESARTEANREAKRLEAAWRSLVSPGADVPDVEVSAREIIEELEAARAHNLTIQTAASDYDTIARAIDAKREQIRALEAEISSLNDRAEIAHAGRTQDPVDTEGIEARLNAVEDTNRAVRAKVQWTDAKAAGAAALVVADDAEKSVQAARQAKADALKAAEFPHPALSVDDDYVLVDGVAWPYVNSAEKSLVALAVAIHDAPTDGLRIVILKEGDWLDANTLARANEMLTERGFFALVDRGRPDLPDTAGIDVLELVDGQAA